MSSHRSRSDEAELTLGECEHRSSALGRHHVENQIAIHRNLEVLARLVKRRQQRVGSEAPPMATLQPLPELKKSAKKISAPYQNIINENVKLLSAGKAQFEVLIFGARGSKSMSVYSANQEAIARNIERLAKYLEKDPCTRLVLDDSFQSIPFPDTRVHTELCLNQVYINEMLFVLARGLDEMSQPTHEMRPKLPTASDYASRWSCVLL